MFHSASTCPECRCILATVTTAVTTGMVAVGVNRAGGTSIMARAAITAHVSIMAHQGWCITARHVANGVMARVITVCPLHRRQAITNGITALEAHAGSYRRINWRNAFTLLRLTGTSKSRSLSRRI